MAEHSLDQLREWEEELQARINTVQAQLEELEDMMNTSDEQQALQERLERLVAKFYAVSEAIANHEDLAGFDSD